jgi:hypothetical protein
MPGSAVAWPVFSSEVAAFLVSGRRPSSVVAISGRDADSAKGPDDAPSLNEDSVNMASHFRSVEPIRLRVIPSPLYDPSEDHSYFCRLLEFPLVSACCALGVLA